MPRLAPAADPRAALDEPPIAPWRMRLGLDRVLAVVLWQAAAALALLGGLAMPTPPGTPGAQALVAGLVVAALAGLLLQWSALRPRETPTARTHAARWATGAALTLPALLALSALPITAPGLWTDGPSPAALLATAAALTAHGLGIVVSTRLLGLTTWARRNARAHLARTARWQRVGADAPDAHLFLRAGDARVQVFDGLVQLWHRDHRLELDVETRLLRDLPHGLRLELERPDRYVLLADAPLTPERATELGRAAARLAVELLERPCIADDAAPLQGHEPPAEPLAASLELRSPRGHALRWVLAGEQLRVDGDGPTVSFDLARPFNLLLGQSGESRGGRFLHLTVRQREAAHGVHTGGEGGLAIDVDARGGPEGRWLQARLCVAVQALTPELERALPRESAPAPCVSSHLAFTALWRQLYWCARAHGVPVRSLPVLAPRREHELGEGARLAHARPDELEPRLSVAPRLVALGVGVGAALGTFAAAIDHASSATTLQLHEASAALMVLLGAGLAALAAAALLGVLGRGRMPARRLVAHALGEARAALLALAPALDPAALSAMLPRTSLTLAEQRRRGLRLDAVLHAGGPLWATLSTWPAGTGPLGPMMAEQLEIHARRDTDTGERLARELARVQMLLLAAGRPAMLMSAGDLTTLALQSRRRVGASGGAWRELALLVANPDAPLAERARVRGEALAATPAWPTPPRHAGPRLLAARHTHGPLALGAATAALACIGLGALPQAAVHDTTGAPRPAAAATADPAPDTPREPASAAPATDPDANAHAAPARLDSVSGIDLLRVDPPDTHRPLYVTAEPVAFVDASPTSPNRIVPVATSADVALCSQLEPLQSAVRCVCQRYGMSVPTHTDTLVMRMALRRGVPLHTEWLELQGTLQHCDSKHCTPELATTATPLLCLARFARR